jgi:hypothetical protein
MECEQDAVAVGQGNEDRSNEGQVQKGEETSRRMFQPVVPFNAEQAEEESMSEKKIVRLPIQSLCSDTRTQCRAKIDTTLVDEYADAMTQGIPFPPIRVMHEGDGENAINWVIDGHHRVAAARKAEINEIEAEVEDGSLAEAQWHAASANCTHGLRRCTADKKKAIQVALLNRFGESQSDSQLGCHVGCSPKLVKAVRETLVKQGKLSPSTVRVGRDGRQIDTKNIGRRKRDFG